MTEQSVRICGDVRGNQTPAELRASILDLETVMLAMPQIEIPIEHFFAPGIYMRQMTMPKGAVITGKIHKTEHYCILVKGTVTVVSPDGRKTIQAPHVVHSTPGAKRAIHAHEESVWINVHPNSDDAKDLDAIEERLIAKTFAEVPGLIDEPKQIQGGE